MTASREERLAQAREQFKTAAKAKEEAGEGSGNKLLKLKSSSSGLTVTNGAMIKSDVTGYKYSISVSATVTGDGASADDLLELQTAIAKFLRSVHEEF